MSYTRENRMVKLSQQLRGNRITRTERVEQAYQEKLSREEEERQYNTLQQRAENLKQTSFSNIKTAQEYREKYRDIPEELKSFFATPEQVAESQVRSKEQDKINAQNRIVELERRYQEEERQYRQRSEELNQARGSDAESIASDLRYRSSRMAGLKTEIDTIKNNMERIDEGASFKDIISFASERGSSEQMRLNKADEMIYSNKYIPAKTEYMEVLPAKRIKLKPDVVFAKKGQEYQEAPSIKGFVTEIGKTAMDVWIGATARKERINYPRKVVEYGDTEPTYTYSPSIDTNKIISGFSSVRGTTQNISGWKEKEVKTPYEYTGNVFKDITTVRGKRLKAEEYEKNQRIIGEILKESNKNISEKYSVDLSGKEQSKLVLGDISYEDILQKKQQTYEGKTISYNKQIEDINKKVEEYNVSKSENQTQYNYLLGKQKELESKKVDIENIYSEYESDIKRTETNLSLYGAKRKVDAEGKVTYEQEGKLQYPYLTDASKLKSTPAKWAYAGGRLAYSGVELGLLSYGLGSMGAFAKVSSGVKKTSEFVFGTGKVLKVASFTGKLGSTVLVGGLAGYKGYKLETETRKLNLPKGYGVLLGTGGTFTDIGAVGVGGYYGTKAYYSSLQKQIVDSTYSKTFTNRRGVIKGRYGVATQKDVQYIKIKDTPYKIKLKSKLEGRYGEIDKYTGRSVLQAQGEFIGKVPKGYAKSFTLKGYGLETNARGGSYKFRMYYEGKNGLYEQDVLMQNTMTRDITVPYGSTKSGRLRKLAFLTESKLVGSPKKIKEVPMKDVFKKDELYRFLKWKGQPRVFQGYEWTDQKLSQLSKTEQVVVSVKKNDAQVFKSIGRSEGYSPKLLKDKLMIYLKKTGQVFFTNVPLADKRGTFAPQQFDNTPSLEKEYTILNAKDFATATSTKAKVSTKLINPRRILNEANIQSLTSPFLKSTLKDIYAEQLIFTTPSILGISSLTSIKGLTLLKDQTKLKNQLKSLTKVSQVQVATPMQKLTQKEALVQRLTPTLTTKQIINQITKIETPSKFTTPTKFTGGFPPFPPYMKGISGTPFPKKSKKTSMKQIYAYFPDFTSRALGLEPEIIKQEDLSKELTKLRTGLEIRRGVIVNE